MTIRPEKWDQLHKKMADLHIDEKKIIEQFVVGAGKGGQKAQKSHNCVIIKYLNHEIRCHKTRSREDNRFFARRKLCEIIEGDESAKSKKIDKIRKQKNRRKRRTSSGQDPIMPLPKEDDHSDQ